MQNGVEVFAISEESEVHRPMTHLRQRDEDEEVKMFMGKEELEHWKQTRIHVEPAISNLSIRRDGTLDSMMLQHSTGKKTQYDIGDFIMFDDYERSRRVRFGKITAMRGNFCRSTGTIEYSLERTTLHLQNYLHGCETLIKEMAHPRILFKTRTCVDIPASKVLRRIKLSEQGELGKHDSDGYTCLQEYDQQDQSFTTLGARLIPRREIVSSEEGDCEGCDLLAHQREREVIRVYRKGKERGLQKGLVRYTAGCVIKFKGTGSSSLARLGIVRDFITGDGDRCSHALLVDKLLAFDDAIKETEVFPGHKIVKEERMFRLDTSLETTSVPVDAIIGKVDLLDTNRLNDIRRLLKARPALQGPGQWLRRLRSTVHRTPDVFYLLDSKQMGDWFNLQGSVSMVERKTRSNPVISVDGLILTPVKSNNEIANDCSFPSEDGGKDRDGQRVTSPTYQLYDLCSGAGLLGTGLCDGSGRRIIPTLAVDTNTEALALYKANHTKVETIPLGINCLVRRHAEYGRSSSSTPLVISAGVPCQGFSKANR